MTPAARSIRVFAVYLLLLALVLLIAPNPLLQAFGLPPTSHVWIRVVGLLVDLVGVYDWPATAGELAPFVHLKLLARFTLPAPLLVSVAVVCVPCGGRRWFPRGGASRAKEGRLSGLQAGRWQYLLSGSGLPRRRGEGRT